jgi:membrane fusion protein, heavy metal efflux system
MRGLTITLLATLLFGCKSEETKAEAPKSEAPAKLAGTVVKEAELTTVTLTADAETRLGIRLEEATGGSGSAVRRIAGEIITPIGSNVVVSSSVAGTLQAEGTTPSIGSSVRQNQILFTITPLLPVTPLSQRDLHASAEGDVAQARARVENARQRKTRADRMLADEVGTIRAQEEAQQELVAAQAALDAANNRLKQIQTAPPFESDMRIPIKAPQDGMLRQIFVASGQSVNAGAPLFEVVDLRNVWIRVPVYAGEAATFNSNASVAIQAINGTGQSWTARPIAAPPSANSTSSTVDLYYTLPNESLRFKPGEKVTVSLRSSGSQNWIEVPWSAVVFDTNGGSWVYESLGDRHYRRRRVNLDHSVGGRAYLTAGLPAGTKVVADGAAELWGFEFGTGK